MRIATVNNYDNTIESLMQRQSTLTQTQQQMSTGKRVNVASDDPAAAAISERAQAEQARITATQKAVAASNNAMTLTESALGSAGSLLQTVRDTLVQAGNGSLQDADRSALSQTLVGLRQQLLTLSNSTDGSGNYLFGGQSATQAPFSDTVGGVQYQGTPGVSQAAGNEGLPLSVDGSSAWMTARTGNGVFTAGASVSNGTAWIDSGKVTNPAQLTGATYSINFSVGGGSTTYSILKNGAPTPQTNVAFSTGQAVQIDGMSATISGSPASGDSFTLAPSTPTLSVFGAIDKAIADLKTPNLSGAQRAQANSENLANIDSSMNLLSAARSAAGATMNRISAVTDRLSALTVASKTGQSNAEDLDMTQAISDFNNQQTGYSAALKAYSLVQHLSLFNYLSS
ncbi:MAG: flagellar hook-associated protein FlgL [Pseudomonadota bacterium]|nr:flagellar hook-associated protein FlgL [Pseudomonadota bacterium]